MLSESIMQEIDTMLHDELSKVVDEHDTEFAEGWLAGCTWTINTVIFFKKIEEMKEQYEGKTTKNTSTRGYRKE